MVIRLYADPYRCAIYQEAPGGGDPMDPASLRNRPVVDPSNWLANIRFHSDFDYYGVAAYTLATTLFHAAVPGAVRQGSNSVTASFIGQSGVTDQVLLQHDLGYVPEFYGIQAGRLIPNGIPVQYPGPGRMRWASIYATASQIRVQTFGFSSDAELPAASITYGAIVFRDHAPVNGEDMLRLAPGDVVFGQGKFRMSDPHLRVVEGSGSQFAIATSRTAGVANGGLRAWLPNGTSLDWGAYNGGLAAPSFTNIEVGI